MCGRGSVAMVLDAVVVLLSACCSLPFYHPIKFLFGGTATMVCMITISWIHDVLVGGSGSGLLRLVALVVYLTLSLPRSLARSRFILEIVHW